MNTKHFLFAVFSTCFVLGCSPQKQESTSQAAPASQPACNYTVGFDVWDPYQYVDVGDRVTGLDIELIQAVAGNMNCTLSFRQGTWVEMLNDLKNGEVDMLMGASKTEAREEFAYFSDPYRKEVFNLYIRTGDKEHASMQSLDDFFANKSKIGVVEDYYYGPAVAIQRDSPMTSQYFVSGIMGELNVARLLDGDIDGFLEDSFVGASMLRRKALSNYITEHGLTIETGDVYVMFSKQTVSPEQVSSFNQELNNVKQDNTYKAIVDKYSL